MLETYITAGDRIYKEERETEATDKTQLCPFFFFALKNRRRNSLHISAISILTGFSVG